MNLLAASQLRRKRRDRAWFQWRARAEVLERRLAFHLRKYFMTERARVLRLLNQTSLRAAEIDEEDDGEEFTLSVSLVELQRKLKQAQEENNEDWEEALLIILLLMAAGITSMTVLELGFDFEGTPSKTETWTKAFLATALALVAAASLRKIISIIVDAQAKRQSLPRTISRINDAYATFIKSRTPGIASDMIGKVASMAQQIAILQLGVPLDDLRQTWVQQVRPSRRESHYELDGETRKIGEEFKPGLKFPRDPNAPIEETINCGCWLMIQQVRKERRKAA